MTYQQILDAALTLTADQRQRLVSELLASLDDAPLTPIGQAWNR